MAERMRVQKFLSRAEVASRRKAERMMRQGRVRVNGEVATEMGTKVDPDRDTVEVDGRRVGLAPPTWIAVNKPNGYVSTRRDPGGRSTVYDVIPGEFAGLFYVGRLDRDSEGLMLFTNQGDVANRLMHPRYGVDRVYRVDVRGRLSDAVIERLLDGVELEDGPARAQAVKRRGRTDGGDRVDVTLREGRKREVRRMFDAVGHPVRRLVRIRYGPIELGSLASGSWRHLSDEERTALDTHTSESADRS